MGSEGWPEVRLVDIQADVPNAIAAGPFGSNLVRADYRPTGVPVIRGSNLDGSRGRFNDSEFVFVSSDKADSMRGNLARPGDIVVTQRGTLGQVGLIPDDEEHERFVLSQSQMKLTCDRVKTDPLFVFYWLSSASTVDYLKRNAVTTGVPHINLSFFREMRMPLPPLPKQREIARVLSALDDKIDLNRRMNRTLESIARAIFTSWFVDFEHPHNTLAGGDATASGWPLVPFADTVEILSGGTPRTSEADYWGGEVPWYSVADAPSHEDVFVVRTEKTVTDAGVENSAAQVVSPLTTIISARGTVGKCALSGRPMAFNQSCFGLRPVDGIGGYYTYFSTLRVVDQLRRSAHGSVFSTITRPTFAAAVVPLPPSRLVREFENAVRPSMQRILLNVRESETLRQTRDALLPKLLSGELPVDDIDDAKSLPQQGLCVNEMKTCEFDPSGRKPPTDVAWPGGART